MSSHREAPGISKDPVADYTDTYAFVSPDRPDTVTLITNYVPLQDPAGGPNFFEFGDDVLYEIKVDNNGDGVSDVTYQFRFTTTIANNRSFLYNTGQILSLDSPNWNRKQVYSVTKVWTDRSRKTKSQVLATGLSCPPCNIGPRSTPTYAALADAAIHSLPGGVKVFAGQRAEGFYADLGAVFDLADLRPFQNLHVIPSAAVPGINSLKDLSVHSIAIQVPKTDLAGGGTVERDGSKPAAVIGVWGSASRQKGLMRKGHSGEVEQAGPWVQVSRLGNPLFNEVIVPMAEKDEWNAREPSGDGKYAEYVLKPELAALLPVLYPTAFPNLKALTKARTDLLAVLLTGIPPGLIPGFQNYTGPTRADMLRLNITIPPSAHPSDLGVLGGDLAGFPNGRRPADDVVTIELRAVAGLTHPLVNPRFVPDAATSVIDQGLNSNRVGRPYLNRFPYLGVPISGYDVAVA